MLTSDLVGTTVALPAPLGKPAEESAPVWLRIGSDAQAPVRIDAGYDARIAFNVAVGRQNAGWQATGVHARLGALEAPPARAGSFLLDGRVDRLEPAAWFAALDRLASPPGAAAGDAGLNINAADIEVKHLVWGDERLRPTRLQYRPTADGWQLDLTGEGAEGRLSWWPGGGGRLSARLAHLRLDVVPPPPAAMAGETPAPPSEPPADPSRFPVLDLLCDQLGVGDVVLGRVELASERVPGGLALRRLRISGGITDLDLAGAWRRIGGKSSAELRFDLASGDVSKLLAALGYAPSLDADRSHFSGELGWAPAAEGLRWELADGRIDVEVEQGQLRAVQPGASRVLGLINFYALPRRLTLDFADVVGEGLAFDRIKGRFDLAAGDATTGDLHIDGPSLRMDIRGRVGLVARDYDQRVTVYPDVSAGVTLGAVLLGGPAVGALVLLAQELLDKPLDQVTQFSYRISGPWDNPRVERLDAAARPG